MTEAKTKAETETKCCDSATPGKFCQECGKRRLVDPYAGIPAYRRQLDKYIATSVDIVVCRNTIRDSCEFDIVGCREYWKSVAHGFENEHVMTRTLERKIDLFDELKIKYAILGSQISIRNNGSSAGKSHCSVEWPTVGEYIMACVDAGIEMPCDGRNIQFTSDIEKKWGIESTSGKIQTVAVKYVAPPKNDWRQDNIDKALDEIKTKLYYSPNEKKLYSAEDIVKIIGRTLDFLGKDLDAVCIQRKVRNINVAVLHSGFRNLPFLCRLSSQIRGVVGVCEGVSAKQLAEHLFS